MLAINVLMELALGDIHIRRENSGCLCLNLDSEFNQKMSICVVSK